ncbi:MAG: hypothetical protein H0U59_12005, partial [Gemmatimonadaceae bacterium]|nr:hypothetical protein [Gemmatimonadaceae bacterium]
LRARARASAGRRSRNGVQGCGEHRRDELGARINKLFASFEEKPLGSASLGQVHAAPTSRRPRSRRESAAARHSRDSRRRHRIFQRACGISWRAHFGRRQSRCDRSGATARARAGARARRPD